VEGTVSLRGEALAGIQVSFVPDTEQDTAGPRSVAFTDKDGHYKLMCDNGSPGAVVGRHRVLLHDTRILGHKAPAPPMLPPVGDRKAPPDEGAASAAKPKFPPGSRIPPRYSRVSDTPLVEEVLPGPQTVDFNLTP
jgi:hypothetical protein